MNWIGWTVLSVLLSIMLFLLMIPYILLGISWGIFITIIFYFYMNGLFWLVCRGEVSYWNIMKLPFVNLYDWFKKI